MTDFKPERSWHFRVRGVICWLIGHNNVEFANPFSTERPVICVRCGRALPKQQEGE